MNIKRRLIILTFIIILVALSIFLIEKSKPSSSPQNNVLKDGIYPKSPELVGIEGYINTKEGLSIESLKGKVVLIDFWTYTCINCLRTLPYLTSWDKKYSDKGSSHSRI